MVFVLVFIFAKQTFIPQYRYTSMPYLSNCLVDVTCKSTDQRLLYSKCLDIINVFIINKERRKNHLIN